MEAGGYQQYSSPASLYESITLILKLQAQCKTSTYQISSAPSGQGKEDSAASNRLVFWRKKDWDFFIHTFANDDCSFDGKSNLRSKLETHVGIDDLIPAS